MERRVVIASMLELAAIGIGPGRRDALFQAIHGEMSGSIADNTWSHNKGGAYVRQRRIPTNPNSASQQAVRAVLSPLSSAWRALSSANQTGWDNWAAINPAINALGIAFNRSGHQAYVGLNANILAAGGSRIDTAPVAAAPPELITLTIAPTSPDQVVVTYTTTPLTAGTKLVVWGTLPGSAGRNPNINQARRLGFSAAAAASPQTITSPYPALTGMVSNFFAGIMGADGQLGVMKKFRSAWA